MTRKRELMGKGEQITIYIDTNDVIDIDKKRGSLTRSAYLRLLYHTSLLKEEEVLDEMRKGITERDNLLKENKELREKLNALGVTDNPIGDKELIADYFNTEWKNTQERYKDYLVYGISVSDKRNAETVKPTSLKEAFTIRYYNDYFRQVAIREKLNPILKKKLNPLTFQEELDKFMATIQNEQSEQGI